MYNLLRDMIDHHKASLQVSKVNKLALLILIVSLNDHNLTIAF